MNRLEELFTKKKKNILSVFYTAGFPTIDSTISIAKNLEVDFMEIGIPFSDPVADGPVIQESNSIALNNGMTLATLLEQVKCIRQEVSTPIILMGYLNPVVQYGIEKFCRDASQAGVDGVILPDLPVSEYEKNYRELFSKYKLSFPLLIAPTTSEERIRKIDSLSSGFLYAVSSSSTTGSKNEFSAEQVSYFERLKNMGLKNPLMFGFGISNASTFATACQYGAGAIVGSAFIKLLKQTTAAEDISKWVKELRN